MTTKLEKVKTATKLVVGWSTAAVVGRVIHNVAQPETPLKKAETWIAAGIVGNMVAQQAEIHTDKLIDDVAEAVNQIKKTREN